MSPEDRARVASLFAASSAFDAPVLTPQPPPAPAPERSPAPLLRVVAGLIERAVLDLETEDSEAALLALDDALREIKRNA